MRETAVIAALHLLAIDLTPGEIDAFVPSDLRC
jgi:hypothetical protein